MLITFKREKYELIKAIKTTSKHGHRRPKLLSIVTWVRCIPKNHGIISRHKMGFKIYITVYNYLTVKSIIWPKLFVIRILNVMLMITNGEILCIEKLQWRSIIIPGDIPRDYPTIQSLSL